MLTSYVQGGIKQKRKRILSYSVEAWQPAKGRPKPELGWCLVTVHSTLRHFADTNSTRISPFPRVSLRHEQVAQVGVVSVVLLSGALG